MQASRNAMSSGWGQSIHGNHNMRPKWWFFRQIYALFTGQRILICGNKNRVENPPIELFYKYDGRNMNEPCGVKPERHDYLHGFWSHEAGDWTWKTSVTKDYVCTNPKCLAYAAESKRGHDEYFSNPENVKSIQEVMSKIGRMPNTEYFNP